MATQIQLRRDDFAAWNLANPVLADGEVGFCRDLEYLKIGDGVRTWSELPIHAPTTAALLALEAAIQDVGGLAQNAATLAADAVAAVAALPAPGGGGGVVWGASLVFNPIVASIMSGAHGLAGVPDGATRRLVCLAPDLGYMVGDVVEYTGTAQYLTVSCSAVDVTACLSNLNGSTGAFLLHKTANYMDVMVTSKWRLEVTPYKFA